MSRVVGVLLAAGAGRRAGGPKALRLDAAGGPAVGRSIQVLLDGGCQDVVVVVGAAAEKVRAQLGALERSVQVVECADWALGMSASLRTGLLAISPAADAAVVHLVDLPDVPAEAVRRLVSSGRTLARAVYDGRPGHPVLLGSGHVSGVLTTIGGDRGARAYLEAHGATEVECGDLATGVDDDLSPVGRS